MKITSIEVVPNKSWCQDGETMYALEIVSTGWFTSKRVFVQPSGMITKKLSNGDVMFFHFADEFGKELSEDLSKQFTNFCRMYNAGEN